MSESQKSMAARVLAESLELLDGDDRREFAEDALRFLEAEGIPGEVMDACYLAVVAGEEADV